MEPCELFFEIYKPYPEDRVPLINGKLKGESENYIRCLITNDDQGHSLYYPRAVTDMSITSAHSLYVGYNNKCNPPKYLYVCNSSGGTYCINGKEYYTNKLVSFEDQYTINTSTSGMRSCITLTTELINQIVSVADVVNRIRASIIKMFNEGMREPVNVDSVIEGCAYDYFLRIKFGRANFRSELIDLNACVLGLADPEPHYTWYPSLYIDGNMIKRDELTEFINLVVGDSSYEEVCQWCSVVGHEQTYELYEQGCRGNELFALPIHRQIHSALAKLDAEYDNIVSSAIGTEPVSDYGVKVEIFRGNFLTVRG